MKIAVVLDQMLWGGIERVCVSYVKLMVAAGHEVDAYILQKNPESIVEELKALCGKVEIKDLNLRMCPEYAWGVAISPGSKTGNMFRFAAYYAAFRTISAVTKPFLRVKDRRYDLAIAFSGHLRDLTFVADGYIQADHTMAWVHGTQYQYALLSPAYFRLYTRIKNLVCLSEVGDADCIAYNREHRINKRKVYNPCIVNSKAIDEEKVQRLRREHGDFCLMVGRLASDKDQDTVIRAMKHLKEQFGMEKKLVLVGDGPRREELEELVSAEGMGAQVVFEGTRSDVQNYYTAATVYVHGSPLEGLPTVFLEAMHFGLPVVSTEALAGGREILGNDEYGLISPNWNPEALARNIYRVYADEKLRNELIANGKRRLVDFEPDQVYQQFSDFVREICAEDGKTAVDA